MMTGKKSKHTLKEIWVNKPMALRHIKFLFFLTSNVIFFFTTKQWHWVQSPHFLALGWNEWTTQVSVSVSDSSETDTITKSLGLAGIGWEAGINWPLSATKKTKTTSKWGDIVPGPHALFRASLYPGLTLQNPKASLDSLSYHQRISIAPDQALGQPQRLPDEYNFVCATKLPPQGWLCNQPS